MFLCKCLATTKKESNVSSGNVERNLRGEQEARAAAFQFNERVAELFFDSSFEEQGRVSAQIARERENTLPDSGIVETCSTRGTPEESFKSSLITEGEDFAVIILVVDQIN